MKTILVMLFTKGVVIGVLTAILKILFDIRTGKFRWIIAITDLVGCAIMGYVAWELVKDSETLAIWHKVFFTSFMSINIFIIIKIITNPKLVEFMLSTWSKIKVEIKDKEDE